jgi:hypothetical protein
MAGVDLKTMKIAWQHRNGTIRDSAPVPLPIKLGVPSLGGPMITDGGVAFPTSTTDYFIRAYDVTDSKKLWQVRLPAGGQSTPMSYAVDGKQYVVTAAGGHGSFWYESRRLCDRLRTAQLNVGSTLLSKRCNSRCPARRVHNFASPEGGAGATMDRCGNRSGLSRRWCRCQCANQQYGEPKRIVIATANLSIGVDFSTPNHRRPEADRDV